MNRFRPVAGRSHSSPRSRLHRVTPALWLGSACLLHVLVVDVAWWHVSLSAFRRLDLRLERGIASPAFDACWRRCGILLLHARSLYLRGQIVRRLRSTVCRIELGP
jgi:hypothetical protein